MLTLTTAALSLVLPTPIDMPAMIRPAPMVRAVSLPTTATLAGLFGPDPETFKGGADSMDLSSLLDTVPEDPGGKKGAKRDQEGMRRLKERQQKEQDAAALKYEAVLAAEAAGKDVSFQGDVKELANNGFAAAQSLFGGD